MTIYPICQKYNVTKLKELSVPEKQSVDLLSDLALTMKALEAMQKAAEEMRTIGDTLSGETLSIYSNVKVSDPSAIVRIIKTFEETLKTIDALPPKERPKFADDRAKLVKIIDAMKKAAEEIEALNSALSSTGLTIYLETAAAVKESTAAKTLVKTLELTAEKMAAALPEETKTKLGLSAEKKIPEYSQIEPLIVATCTPEEKTVIVELPKNGDKPGKKKVEFDGSAYLRLGFAHRFGEGGSPNAEKGVLIGGGASGALIFDEATKLQLDYQTSFPYDVLGEDDLVFNTDDADLSVVHREKDLAVLVKAGYLAHRNDYPSVVAPNLDAGTQDLRLSYRINDKFLFNLDEGIVVGGAETKYEKGESFYFAGRLAPSATLTLSSVALTLGVVGGWGMLTGIELGGMGGVSHQAGKHDFAALFAMTGWEDMARINGGLQYFYNDVFGFRALYERLRVSEEALQEGDLLLVGRIPLPRDFFLEPFLGGGVSGDDSRVAPEVKAGLTIRFRSLMPQAPDLLMPFLVGPGRGEY